MLFYSYCPECGTESKPFRSEPKDGTPMVCPYCGKTYGYKTRHWMAQRVMMRSLLTIVVLGVLISGFIGGCKGEKKKRVDRLDFVKDESFAVTLDQTDVRNGLCRDFAWGCEKRSGKRQVEKNLHGQLGWDSVVLNYEDKNRGLAGFTLVKNGVEKDEIKKFVMERCNLWSKPVGRNSARSFVKNDEGTSCAIIPLPKDNYGIMYLIERNNDEGHYTIKLSVVNKELCLIRYENGCYLPIDEEELLGFLGYRAVDYVLNLTGIHFDRILK